MPERCRQLACLQHKGSGALQHLDVVDAAAEAAVQLSQFTEEVGREDRGHVKGNVLHASWQTVKKAAKAYVRLMQCS